MCHFEMKDEKTGSHHNAANRLLRQLPAKGMSFLCFALLKLLHAVNERLHAFDRECIVA
jgi:hypothetical protein